MPCFSRRRNRTLGTSLLETLLSVCLLSVALVPLLYLLRLSRPPERKTEMEFMATLLANHVLEKIIAAKAARPDSLPTMTVEEPIVVSQESYQAVSPHFRNILGKFNGLEEDDHTKLYWALKPFKCQVDTYYLEDSLFKVIAYISFEEGGRPRRVFLERLLAHTPSHLQTQEDAP